MFFVNGFSSVIFKRCFFGISVILNKTEETHRSTEETERKNEKD